jgi:hypothetical protein
MTRQRLLWVVLLTGLLAVGAWAQTPVPPTATTLPLQTLDAPTTAFAAVAAALGFGHVAGLGLPLLILILGGLRLAGFWPDWLSPLVDQGSVMWSWPFMALAGGIVGLHALSSSSKITKAFPLVAQLAGVAPSAAFVFASPLLTALAASRAAVAASGEADGVASMSMGFLVLLGVVALLSFVLMALLRLMVHVLVWLSPFPMLDMAITVGFHVYALVLVVLAIAWPTAALVLAVVQTLVAIIVIRKLWALSRAMWGVVVGALQWHADGPAPTVAISGAAKLDQLGSDSLLRVDGYADKVPGVPRFAPVVVGVRDGNIVICPLGGQASSPSLQLMRVREGVLHDELQAQLADSDKRIVISIPKSHRHVLRQIGTALGVSAHDA